MPIQYKVGRRIVGQECGETRDLFSHRTDQRRKLPFGRSVAIAVNDVAKAQAASHRFGEHQGVECKRQPVVLGESVGELETVRDKLDGPGSSFRGHLFYCLQTRFEAAPLQTHIRCDAPFHVRGMLGDGRGDCAAFRKHCEQAFASVLVIGLVL
jgi:hypothetical protein